MTSATNAPPEYLPPTYDLVGSLEASCSTGGDRLPRITPLSRQGSLDDDAALAQALALSLQASEEMPDAPPPPPGPPLLAPEFDRRVSAIAAAEADSVRNELASTKDGYVWSPTPGATFPVSWSTYLLPADPEARARFPLAAEIMADRGLFDAASGRSAFSWAPPGYVGTEPEVAALCRSTELCALRTDGDGNCLLHAAALAAWGVHDRDLALPCAAGLLGPLRDQVASLLRSSGFVDLLLPRLAAEEAREQAAVAAVMPEAAVSEARSVEALRSDVALAARLAAQPAAFLDKLHVFALAHVLRRPLVVYADEWERDADGDAAGRSSLEGLYLPELWRAADASVHAGWSKGPAWRRHSWPPRAPQTASEGLGLPLALVERGPAGQIPPRGRGLSDGGHPRCQFRCV